MPEHGAVGLLPMCMFCRTFSPVGGVGILINIEGSDALHYGPSPHRRGHPVAGVASSNPTDPCFWIQWPGGGGDTVAGRHMINCRDQDAVLGPASVVCTMFCRLRSMLSVGGNGQVQPRTRTRREGVNFLLWLTSHCHCAGLPSGFRTGVSHSGVAKRCPPSCPSERNGSKRSLSRSCPDSCTVCLTSG